MRDSWKMLNERWSSASHTLILSLFISCSHHIPFHTPKIEESAWNLKVDVASPCFSWSTPHVILLWISKNIIPRKRYPWTLAVCYTLKYPFGIWYQKRRGAKVLLVIRSIKIWGEKRCAHLISCRIKIIITKVYVMVYNMQDRTNRISEGISISLWCVSLRVFLIIIIVMHGLCVSWCDVVLYHHPTFLLIVVIIILMVIRRLNTIITIIQLNPVHVVCCWSPSSSSLFH